VKVRTARPWYRIGTVAVLCCAGAWAFTATSSAGGTARPPGSASRPVAAPALCGSVAGLDRLVVSRADAFPKNHVHFAFPGVVTVTDVAAVRGVARALCALPKMPTGLFCPADWGITYQFAFSARGRTFPAVVADATGCQRVTGLGGARSTARSPQFWVTLGRAMGLAHPRQAVFAGSR
jgi:hypothetical protein